jgi:hypothetical protein
MSSLALMLAATGLVCLVAGIFVGLILRHAWIGARSVVDHAEPQVIAGVVEMTR